MKPFEILLYAGPEGKTNIEVFYEEETFWLSQKKMGELFGVDVRTINEHLQNIFKIKELEKEATIRKFRIVQKEGVREVSREVDFYNLDAIIAVGYRVNSIEATRFRIWATKTLREFIIKGFVLDDERLKQGSPNAASIMTPAPPPLKPFISSSKTNYTGPSPATRQPNLLPKEPTPLSQIWG